MREFRRALIGSTRVFDTRAAGADAGNLGLGLRTYTVTGIGDDGKLSTRTYVGKNIERVNKNIGYFGVGLRTEQEEYTHHKSTPVTRYKAVGARK